ncbi:MAG: hypothetical protein HKN56_07675 [Gammaproteobacteria bacterium]|nr:hypothetical protein [Gammaproteobacteria bacterium]NND54834.1 hypothetical protein [Gammaproteobacteria bacterium]
MVRAAHLDDSQQLEEQTKIAAKTGKSSFKAAKTGYEGREAEVGKAVQLALKTMANSAGYQHEMNDALVKARLQAMQFAKDNGMMEQYVEHDIKTMRPINTRVGMVIEKTGDLEAALVGLTERTACHYHLVLETEAEPGMRRWKSPWGNVLNACKRMDMFDLTEEEIHNTWFKPRIEGYAKDMGVEVEISDWNEDGIVELRLPS